MNSEGDDSQEFHLEDLVAELDEAPRAGEVSGPRPLRSQIATQLPESDSQEKQHSSKSSTTLENSSGNEDQDAAHQKIDHSNEDPDIDLDEIIADFDPEFAADTAKLREESEDGETQPSGNIEIDMIEISVADREIYITRRLRLMAAAFVSLILSALWQIRTRPVVLLKKFQSHAWDIIQTQGKLFLKYLNNKFRLFMYLKASDKIKVAVALVFVTLSLIVIPYLYSKKDLNPDSGPWTLSLEHKAAATFHFSEHTKFVDLNDPILHPEHVFLVDRIIANLRRTRPGANTLPMTMLDLYLQLNQRASAIEVGDRIVEVRDQIARTTESFTYEELQSAEGKEKLKLLIRKDLNRILIKGRIRRVFIKTIVLNPE